MKIRKSVHNLFLLLCTTLLFGACNGDMELSPEAVELEGPIAYGTATLDIAHQIPLGIGEVVVETSVPLKFPVKEGDRHIAGSISEDKEAESTWDLAAAGDVVGASTTVIVPTTFEIRGVFENCAFTFDIIETMHFSQVTTANVLAWGDIDVDLGEDEEWAYFNKVLTGDNHELAIEEPSVAGTLYLSISNVSLPPDTQLVCGYLSSDE